MNLENNKPREQLLNLYEGEHPVFLRIISRLENRFKNILIYFNMQFLDPESIKPQSLTKANSVDNYIKVLFSPEDFIIWSKLFPFKPEIVNKLLEESIGKFIKAGALNSALKLKFIKLILEEADNVALTLGRVFFSLSENFFNFGIYIVLKVVDNFKSFLIEKEADTLVFLFKHLDSEKDNNSNNLESEKKLNLQQIEPFFNDFSEKLVKNKYFFFFLSLNRKKPCWNIITFMWKGSG